MFPECYPTAATIMNNNAKPEEGYGKVAGINVALQL